MNDIIAYLGLLLGIINLSLYLYKEFLKKGKLQILENKLIIKQSHSRDNFAFQLDLKLRASNNSISINSIQIINKKGITGTDNNTIFEIELFKGIHYKSVDITVEKNLIEFLKDKFQKTNYNLIDLKIEKDTNKSITFVDILNNVLYSDGYDDTPRENWKLKISYDNKNLIIPINPNYYQTTANNSLAK